MRLGEIEFAATTNTYYVLCISTHRTAVAVLENIPVFILMCLREQKKPALLLHHTYIWVC